MLRSSTLMRLFAALAVLAFAAHLSAGGFWVVLGNPEANPEAQSMKAVLTMQTAGCHQPENAIITGTAIGIIKGERQSVPLKPIRLSQPGMFALTQQWPAEGRWVIKLVSSNEGAVTSTLVSAGPGGIDRKGAKLAMRQPSEEDVEALLRVDTRTETVARK